MSDIKISPFTKNGVYAGFQKEAIFENRFYRGIGIKKEDIFQDNVEQKGMGVRSYGKLWGFFLNLIGLAYKVTMDGKDFYLNKKSLAKLAVRRSELVKPFSEGPRGVVAKKMHELYLRHEQVGYDPVALRSAQLGIEDAIERQKATAKKKA